MLLVKGICSTDVPHTVADPDLQIRGGPDHPDPEIRGEGGLQKDFFRPFGPQFGLKIRGAGPLGTSPGSATAIERGVFAIAMIYHVGNYSAKNFRSDLTNLYGCLLPKNDVFNIITIVWINADLNVEINYCEPRLVSVSKRCM